MDNRYSLVSTSNGKCSVIKIDEYDHKMRKTIRREKVSLASIDLLTSHFSSAQDFNRYFNLPENSKISIIYQFNKKQREIHCIYSDNLLMRYFAGTIDFNKNEIAEYDQYFRKLLSKILLMVCKPNFKKHLMIDSNINVYIKEKITNYLYTSYNEKFIVDKLILELRKYKNLRSFISNIVNYEKSTGEKIIDFSVPEIEEYLVESNISLSRFIPSDTILEPLFLLNSEEEKNYNDYMANLPYDFCCHEEYHRLNKKR